MPRGPVFSEQYILYIWHIISGTPTAPTPPPPRLQKLKVPRGTVGDKIQIFELKKSGNGISTGKGSVLSLVDKWRNGVDVLFRF